MGLEIQRCVKELHAVTYCITSHVNVTARELQMNGRAEEHLALFVLHTLFLQFYYIVIRPTLFHEVLHT